ncbi:MAG: bifunctional DNA-formamidopyrimidine glycosylase/DNA-(apurinic or apyrimidinic site) lyase [Archangium sp.]
MPELPEVEFARRALKRWFKGRKLVRTEAEDVRTFREGDLGVFKALEGPLDDIGRRGKFLVVSFENKLGFVGHLGMTGKFLKRKPTEEVRWSRARFHLDNSDIIHFQDPRMFGFIDAVPASELWKRKAVAKLGLDPLEDDFTLDALKEVLGKSKQPLKVALMDQERIAGLGNIHAAEALFRSKLHPSRTAVSLDDAEWKALHAAIVATIDFALEEEGGTDDIAYVEEPGVENPFLIYGRADLPCRKCKTLVKKFTQGGRTTHFCPTCQPKNPKKPLQKKKASKR